MDKHGAREADERPLGPLRSSLAELPKKLSPKERLRDGFATGVITTIAALAAYLPTQAFGLREGFWAAITAIFVAQSEFGASRTTARDQFAGAAIGSLISVLAIMIASDRFPSYAIAVVLSVLCAWLLHVATATKLAAVTATILLLVPHQDSVEVMMLSRIAEVAWGICAALATVWGATRFDRRRQKGSAAAAETEQDRKAMRSSP